MTRTFYPNVLDAYDSPTYIFTLYMVHIEDAMKRDYGSSKRRKNIGVSVSQTGVTAELVIDDVTLYSTLSYAKKAGTGTAFDIEFTLNEVLGSNFLDQLHEVSRSLGWEEPYAAEYVLELKFQGHYSGNRTSVGADPLQGKKWIWPMTIYEMDISVNSSGTTYDCKGAIKGDLSGGTGGTLHKAISLPTDSLGDFFTKLESQYAKQQKQEMPNGNTYSDEIKIILHKDFIDNGSIISSSSKSAPTRNVTFKEDEKSNQTYAQFPKDTTVTKIIDNMMASSEYVQAKIKNSGSADGKNEEKKKDKGLSQFYKVVTDTEVVGYNKQANTYARRHLYYIRPFEVIDIPAEKIKPEDASSLRLDAIIKKDLLKKKYEYIYTGMNDQVMDFNIDFKFAFFAKLPGNLGKKSTSDSLSQNSQSAQPDERKSEQEESLVPNPDGTKVNDSSEISPQGGHTTGKVSNAQGVESHSGNGKNVLAAMYEQLTSGDQVMMDLEIKGDPFWLEPVYVDGISNLPLAERTEKLMEHERNLHVHGGQGDNHIVFKCGLPSLGRSYGTNDITSNEYGSISGVFKVYLLESRFSDGKFTQELQCARVVHISNDEKKLKEQ